jgi:hypothetical protein
MKMLLIVILGAQCPSITQSTNYMKALTVKKNRVINLDFYSAGTATLRQRAIKA